MDKGCVLCEIQTKILYTVGTNVRFRVCVMVRVARAGFEPLKAK